MYLLYYQRIAEQDKRKDEFTMGILEAMQAVSGILADIGEITFQGMNIYLLARRIEEEEEKENPPE